MSEFGDDMRDWRKRRQRDRAKNAVECEGCMSRFPMRDPTKLYPGMTCGWCGYTDKRVPPATKRPNPGGL